MSPGLGPLPHAKVEEALLALEQEPGLPWRSCQQGLGGGELRSWGIAYWCLFLKFLKFELSSRLFVLWDENVVWCAQMKMFRGGFLGVYIDFHRTQNPKMLLFLVTIGIHPSYCHNLLFLKLIEMQRDTTSLWRLLMPPADRLHWWPRHDRILLKVGKRIQNPTILKAHAAEVIFASISLLFCPVVDCNWNALYQDLRVRNLVTPVIRRLVKVGERRSRHSIYSDRVVTLPRAWRDSLMDQYCPVP
jgi:hypothetical protein